jgi:hypothetical protein
MTQNQCTDFGTGHNLLDDAAWWIDLPVYESG